MGDEKKSVKANKKTASYVMNEESSKGFKQISAETGLRESDLHRMADKEFLENRYNRPAEMLQLVLLTQTFGEMLNSVPNDNQELRSGLEQCQQYINNIMVLKGGK